jgi:hypothetical protein
MCVHSKCVRVCALNISMLYHVFICIIFTYVLQLIEAFNRITAVQGQVKITVVADKLYANYIN